LNVILILLVSTVLSWYFTKLIINPFSKLIPDIPNKRSSHSFTKPRAGGLAFIISNFFSSLIFGQNNFAILLPLFLMGFVDDIFNIKKLYKFVIQIGTCFLLFYKSSYFDLINQIDNLPFKALCVLTIVIFLSAIINFCNFMDGIDGILAGSILVCLVTFAFLLSGSVWTLIGSLFGFLIWNWKPSKIFMGDIGSNFLGGVLVWIILNSQNIFYSIGILLIAAPLLIDPLLCLFRRLYNRQNIFIPHSLHLYQRLCKGGLSHSKVSTLYIVSSIFISISFFIGGLKLEIFSISIILIFAIWLEKNFAITFDK